MNRRFFYALLGMFAGVFCACTDVVQVDLPEGQQRLVVDAALHWKQGSTGVEQEIRLSLTQKYYRNKELLPVSDARVKVINSSSLEEFEFVHTTEGRYRCTNFKPVLQQRYRLLVAHQGNTYEAEEVMTATAAITEVKQSVVEGGDPKVPEISFWYRDDVSAENYYLIRFKSNRDVLPYYETQKDEFSNGNLMKEVWEKEDDEDTAVNEEFQKGDSIGIQLIGISKSHYQFMNLLLSQYDNGQGGSPFKAVPVLVKGNVINTTDPSKYPLGYFSVSSVAQEEYLFR